MNQIGEAIGEAARQALPQVDGELNLRGLREPAEIIRDRWGVPHIHAENEHDLFFAQGYVMASDRLFQLELMRRLATGSLSGLFGELTLPLDRFVRTLGWNRTAKKLADAWEERSWAISEAFTAGAVAWAETMPAPAPEYRVLDAEPWVPEGREAVHVQAAAGVMIAWSLSRGWDNDLLRAEIAEQLGTEGLRVLFPDLETESGPVQAGKEYGHRHRLALLQQAMLPPSGQGSNAWVIAGRRSQTGKPLLANDPHLAIQLPSIWYEVHLSAPGIDVAGVTFPFSPGVLIGHNGRIAWGFTSGEGDVQDLYLERLAEEGGAAEYMGEWEPVTVHREEIQVRGRPEPSVVEVRETRHGPVIDSYLIGIRTPTVVEGGIRKTYSLRWAGFDHGIEPASVLRLNTAAGWEEFRAALADWDCPGQNAVYADVDGNIGYQLTGAYPVRKNHDGLLPVPGWVDEYEWVGWIPYEELPRSFNPDEGFLCTANNKPHDESYPHFLGREFLPPFRARRMAQLVTQSERHSTESFARMQMDSVSLSAARVVPALLSVEPADERQKEALSLLADWGQDLGADSAAAALYQVWSVQIAGRILRPLLGEELFNHVYARRQWSHGFLHKTLPTLLAYPSARWFGGDGAAARDAVLREALDGALDELTTRLGDDMQQWRWGVLHRARFAGRLSIIPELAELFTAGEIEMGGDDQTILQGLYEPGVPYEVAVLPSWRQIIDLSDLDASVGILTLGQSGNPVSPHFKDQLELWASGKHHPMPFTRSAVLAAAESTLRLLPAS
ncbi:MAG TPA: penicillin acylase family protein [Actinomycetota bacterium]|nr:penicillin acylase family protein [Actinomycetota bacterium]